MNKKKLRVAIVGTGFIAKQHYEAIGRLAGTEIVAVVGRDEAKTRRFSQEYGIENYFTNFEELFYMDIDVVHICTPNNLHYPMARLALENKINVFCEKPLSLTTEESGHLVELAKESGVLHGVNLNYRSNAMVREMKKRVEEELGDLLLVKGEYIQDWLMFDDDYDWHFEPELVGPSRTVADIGSHLFDLIQFTTDRQIRRLYAKLITVYPTRYKRQQSGETFAHTYSGEAEAVEVVNEDAAMIIAELDDEVKVSMHLSQVTGGFKNGLSLTISGSKESITWKQEEPDKLFIGKRLGGNELVYADPKYVDGSLARFAALPAGHAVGWADGMKNSIAEFYSHVRGEVDNSQSYVDFYKGHRLMQLVEACLISNKEERWVELGELNEE